MNITYISYWSLESGLTQATVLPVVQYLTGRPEVERVTLITAERDKNASDPGIPGVIWKPVFIHHRFTAGHAIFGALVFLFGVVRHHRGRPKPELFWSRSSAAGGVAFLLSRLAKVPFVVESFEPHGEFMVESGTWPANGLKNKVQTVLERLQKKRAAHLITVSEHYVERLSREGVDKERLSSIPCPVDFEQFRFNETERSEVRQRLLGEAHTQARIGIYAGKFGDIYYDREFFLLCRALFELDPGFYLVVLTPMKDHALHRLKELGVAPSRHFVETVDHTAVPGYLSAADFGLCLVRQSPSRKYCSPIKIGEYLANGLPVVISKGIGEDSERIANARLGVVIDMETYGSEMLNAIRSLERGQVDPGSVRYRDMQHAFTIYDHILERLKQDLL